MSDDDKATTEGNSRERLDAVWTIVKNMPHAEEAAQIAEFIFGVVGREEHGMESSGSGDPTVETGDPVVVRDEVIDSALQGSGTQRLAIATDYDPYAASADINFPPVLTHSENRIVDRIKRLEADVSEIKAMATEILKALKHLTEKPAVQAYREETEEALFNE